MAVEIKSRATLRPGTRGLTDLAAVAGACTCNRIPLRSYNWVNSAHHLVAITNACHPSRIRVIAGASDATTP
jgi:hypothetical protein